jgi:hypothetical protein
MCLRPSQVVVAALLLAVASAHESSLRHTHDVEGACDDGGIVTCNTKFMNCVELSGDRCDCRGSVYVPCLSSIRCPGDMISAVIQGCIESGCSKNEVRCIESCSVVASPAVAAGVVSGPCCVVLCRLSR